MRLLFLLIFLVSTQFAFADANKLTIGTIAYGPPFETLADDKDHLNGFDIDLMQTICKRLQYDCQFKAMQFTELFPSLSANKIDLAMAAITITPERSASFLFSMPYLGSSAQFLAKSSSGINSLAEVKGKRVGIELGTIFTSVANEHFKDLVTLVSYKNQQDMMQALENDKVDLVLWDSATSIYWAANNNNLFKLVGPPIPMGYGYGIMANLNRGDLINKINGVLDQLEKDGTYLKIYSLYFTNMTQPPKLSSVDE